MIYVRNQKLTPSQAKDLVHQGFILTLVKMYCGDTDEYAVYVRA